MSGICICSLSLCVWIPLWGGWGGVCSTKRRASLGTGGGAGRARSIRNDTPHCHCHPACHLLQITHERFTSHTPKPNYTQICLPEWITVTWSQVHTHGQRPPCLLLRFLCADTWQTGALTSKWIQKRCRHTVKDKHCAKWPQHTHTNTNTLQSKLRVQIGWRGRRRRGLEATEMEEPDWSIPLEIFLPPLSSQLSCSLQAIKGSLSTFILFSFTSSFFFGAQCPQSSTSFGFSLDNFSSLHQCTTGKLTIWIQRAVKFQ